MFSFFKKKIGGTEVPEWASFFDGREYSLFMKEIDNYFKKLNVKYEIRDGQMIVEENEFGFSNLGLTNVGQVCKQDEPEYYAEIITEHFSSLIRSNEFNRAFSKISDNFDEVKKYIGVRLYDYAYISHVDQGNLIGKDFAGDIYEMIVFDFPDSVVGIRPEQTTAWNTTTDELFEIGRENIKARYPSIITKEAFGEFAIWFVQGDHFFVPNIVFDLENKKELVGSMGSLVGLPHRHAALIYPIESLEVVNAINGIIPAIYGMNQEGPGSLSNNLFWYKDQKFTHLPYKIDDNKLQFFPPDNFLDLLNGLQRY